MYCANNPLIYVDPSGRVVTEWDRHFLSNQRRRSIRSHTVNCRFLPSLLIMLSPAGEVSLDEILKRMEGVSVKSNGKGFLALAIIVLGILALFACECDRDPKVTPEAKEDSSSGNYSFVDQLVAEEYAVQDYIARGAEIYLVKETFYDAESDRYIVLLERSSMFGSGEREYFIPFGDNEDTTPRVAIVGVSDGAVSYFSRGDGVGGWAYNVTPEKVTVEGPNDKVIVFSLD